MGGSPHRACETVLGAAPARPPGFAVSRKANPNGPQAPIYCEYEHEPQSDQWDSLGKRGFGVVGFRSSGLGGLTVYGLGPTR